MQNSLAIKMVINHSLSYSHDSFSNTRKMRLTTLHIAPISLLWKKLKLLANEMVG